jgi:hypothetical protein
MITGGPEGQRQPPVTAGATDPGHKQTGTVRIGIVQVGNKSGKPAELESVRQALVGQLTGERLESIPLETTSQTLIESEAKSKECDYILYSDVTEIKTPSTARKIGGMLGRGGSGQFEARLEYRLVLLSNLTTLLSSNTTGKEEGNVTAAALEAAESISRQVLAEIQKRR